MVGHRHFDALERQVGAFVLDMAHGGVKEERQEGSADEDDNERVQSDFTEHERPVVGENLSTECFDSGRGARALIDVVSGPVGEAHASPQVSLWCAL